MPKLRGLGNFLDTYLQFYLQQKQAELQNRLLSERQIADDARQAQMAEATDLRRDPLMARRYQTAGRQLPPGFVPPTDQELTAPISEDLSKASKIADIRSPLDIVNQAGTRGVDTTPELGTVPRANPATLPGELPSMNLPVQSRPAIEQLLAQRKDKFGRITEANQYEDQRTAATARQVAYEGAMGKENAAVNTFRPELDRALTTIREKAGPEASAAAQKSGAETNARLRAELDPRITAMKLVQGRALMALDIEKATAAGLGKAVAGSQEDMATTLPRLTELQQLWTKAVPAIKASGPASMLGNVGAQLSQTAQPTSTLPTESRLYTEAVEAILPALARATGEVGNLADQEQIRQRYSVPTFVDALNGTGEAKLARLQAFVVAKPRLLMLTANPSIQSLSPTERLNLIDRIVEQTRRELETRTPAGQ